MLALCCVGGHLFRANAAVSRADVEAVVDGLIGLVRQNYVLPDRTETIETRLREGVLSGRYENAADVQNLTTLITADLRSSSGDLHFGIRPKPPAPPDQPRNANVGGTESEEETAAVGPSPGAGIGLIEEMSGRIGYIEITSFPDPALGGAAADEAFGRLEKTEAMILDLRNSRGGHPGMVAYLLSYFFDGEPFLFNRLEWPGAGRRIELETIADLPSPRFTDRPVFILTSRQTPSAAEGFSYHMKHLQRATVVGERTAGAAHLSQRFELPGYELAIPTGRPISPITGGNWEGIGVEPDYEVAADRALDVALELAKGEERNR